jgi:hypothetical protein
MSSPQPNFPLMVPEVGSRRFFKHWLLENVWSTTCIKDHTRVVPIEWMYVDESAPSMCFNCNEEIYFLRKNVAHLVAEGLLPAWYPKEAAKKVLKHGLFFLYAAGGAAKVT